MSVDWAAYETVLRDLRLQQHKLDTAIAAIEALRPQEEGLRSAAETSPTALKGRYAGMTIIDASIKVIEEANGPIHVRRITDAISAGGIVIAGDASNTVGSILNRREKERGDVKRIGRGTWALASYNMALETPVSVKPFQVSHGWDFVPSPDDQSDDL